MAGDPMSAGSPRAVCSHATPILRVADFEAAVAYYRDVLGFTLEWQVDAFGSVCRDDASIMLSQGSQGCGGTWMYVPVSDVDAYHAEIRARGARVRHEPTNFPWRSRELHVFDLDGHVLRFGSEAPEGGALGPWLDERGVRWQPQKDGRWLRVE